MSSLSSLMREYLNESTQSKIQNSLFGKMNSEFPVEVAKKPEWKTLENPPRLSRSFGFEDAKQVAQFTFEVLQFESQMSHNGSLLIQGKKVTVEVYTHTVEDITELDIEYAKELSEIYLDVKDYEKRKPTR